MQKTELLYLHALLAKTHEYLAVRHDLPETFDGYGTREIGPYQVQRPKSEHETAVRLLAERLADEVADETPEPELREA
ncbi:UPF0058 family protein [Halorussus limi]|uniref:UPF0058 family protein n=1 Tax=Halorussus limi TaxID=2938695 RepID=A0A8U0HRZ5_9EURY|nr:UPF0058 family protein [Halorussus limi]UPV73835.1 UPF0058 family protein [Halorussus limi]